MKSEAPPRTQYLGYWSDDELLEISINHLKNISIPNIFFLKDVTSSETTLELIYVLVLEFIYI